MPPFRHYNINADYIDIKYTFHYVIERWDVVAVSHCKWKIKCHICHMLKTRHALPLHHHALTPNDFSAWLSDRTLKQAL